MGACLRSFQIDNPVVKLRWDYEVVHDDWEINDSRADGNVFGELWLHYHPSPDDGQSTSDVNEVELNESEDEDNDFDDFDFHQLFIIDEVETQLWLYLYTQPQWARDNASLQCGLPKGSRHVRQLIAAH